MKKRILLLACALLAGLFWTGVVPSSSAQDDKFSGKWIGEYVVYMRDGSELHRETLKLKFQKTGGSYEALWNNDELDNVSIDGKNISFSWRNIGGGTTYCKGRLTIDEINGTCG